MMKNTSSAGPAPRAKQKIFILNSARGPFQPNLVQFMFYCIFTLKKTLGVKGVIQCVGWVVAASPNSLCVRGRDLIPLDRDLNTNLLGRLKTLQLENIKFVDIFGSPNTDCAGFFFIVVQGSMTLTLPLCHSHYCLMRLVCVLICMKFQSLLI